MTNQTNHQTVTELQKLRSDLSIMIEFIAPELSDRRHIALLDGLSPLLIKREREARIDELETFQWNDPHMYVMYVHTRLAELRATLTPPVKEQPHFSNYYPETLPVKETS